MLFIQQNVAMAMARHSVKVVRPSAMATINGKPYTVNQQQLAGSLELDDLYQQTT